ncbi:MAG: Ribbon-helix-helix protein copG family [Acidimicrobiaceae bacterium]|jgi:metal-responsive CopG/Arc/MetJ family transcriptional regulator
MPKVTSIRLDDDLAEQLEMISRLEGVSVSEEIREAVIKLIDEKRKAPRVVEELDRMYSFVHAGANGRSKPARRRKS